MKIYLDSQNIDFIFNILEEKGYLVGFGEKPGIENSIVKKDLKSTLAKELKSNSNYIGLHFI